MDNEFVKAAFDYVADQYGLDEQERKEYFAECKRRLEERYAA